MKFVPHDYQKRAVEFIERVPASGLFLEMGLGKTVITLTAINDLMYDYFAITKVLVIAPLRVAEDTWSRESEKWDHLRHLRISKILGAAAERKAAIEREADIYVINRENVVWLTEYLEQQKIRWPFDMIVIDELSSFKNNEAKRFRALRKVRPLADRVVGLTGTPAANSLMDLWAEIYLLDRGERLGRTLTAYRGNWFRPAWTSGQIVYKWEPRPGALQQITGRISDITMSMKAEDYLTLPDRIETTISVRLGEDAQKIYREMEKTGLIKLDESEELTAFSAAAIMNKLLQLANGFAYDGEHTGHRFHYAKLDALSEIMEAADSPVLVFYNFQEDKAAIMEKFSDAVELKSDKEIGRWNEGKIRMLLAHPASAGYGLNLQDGGHIIVWFGLPWSLEQYQQAEARILRQGQKYPVMIYYLVAAGTVDEQVVASLQQKDATQSTLFSILKERKK